MFELKIWYLNLSQGAWAQSKQVFNLCVLQSCCDKCTILHCIKFGDWTLIWCGKTRDLMSQLVDCLCTTIEIIDNYFTYFNVYKNKHEKVCLFMFIFLQNRGGSFNKDLRRIPQTFRSSRDIETARDKIDSLMGKGKKASNYNYEEMRDYLKEVA